MSDEEQETGISGEEDLSLPKATINKLINEIISKTKGGISVPKDTRDLLGECCVEFIHLISSEANTISETESKKTIMGEHVVAALETLGFQDYLVQINEVFYIAADIAKVLHEHQQQAKVKDKRNAKSKDSGLTPEEMERAQEELFARAKARMLNLET